MGRRLTTVVVLLGLAMPGLLAAAPAASAGKSTCHVVDATSGQSYDSLQAAVNAAAPGDTLFVKGTCTGTTEIGKNLTLSGQSNGGTKTATLSGGGQGNVLTIDTGASVVLNTLVITDGNNGCNDCDGGGIINYGTLTLNTSSVTGNTAGSSGGGIDNVLGTLTLNNSSVTSNGAGYGGGIFNVSGIVTLNNSSISGNTAFAYGGGVFMRNGTLNLAGTSTITRNAAGFMGGGIYNECGGGTVNGAVAGSGGNVYDNTPDDINSQPMPGGC